MKVVDVERAVHLKPGDWYTSVDLVYGNVPHGIRYKLVAVHDDWIDARDEWGNRRELNRLIWERHMRPEINDTPRSKRRTKR